MDSFLSDWENGQKEIEKLSSGITIKEASNIVAKAKNLGLKDFSLKNFKTNGDKLVLTID